MPIVNYIIFYLSTKLLSFEKKRSLFLQTTANFELFPLLIFIYDFCKQYNLILILFVANIHQHVVEDVKKQRAIIVYDLSIISNSF